ncbi:hypothetical protein ACWKSP_28080 [Micromonosporaceae bacterium Da 78-11]
MTDRMQTQVGIVRGEIQPWADRRPVGGTVLQAFLDDLLPATTARVLVVGPHDHELIAAVAARSGDLTVLVRSVGDAVALRSSPVGDTVTVLAGALDGLDAEPYDVIVAADGLDRVLGYDSPALNWPHRAAALARLAAPGALVVLGVTNEFALTALYDRRPTDERHGDDEWRPLHDDPDRPTSPAQVTAALAGLGLGVHRTYASYDEAGRTHTLLDAGAAARTRPGRLAARLAEAGLAASATDLPLLAPITDGVAAAARAGLLAAVAPGWLVVCGDGGDTRTAYTAGLGLDLDGDGWQVKIHPADGTRSAGSGLVPTRLPDTESVETLLFRLAAAEDVPAFRALAARLGAWADADGLIWFDDVHPDGDGFTRGILGRRGATSTEEALAAAWQRFRDRLVHAHRRHPWPPWMVEGDDLVTAWLAMSGVPADAALLARGRELAGPAPTSPDLRTSIADAESVRVEAVELAGHVFGLERTIRFRDQQLRTRDQQVRTLRDELRRLNGSRAMQLSQVIRKAATIRHPKQFARGLKRRLKG